MFVYIYKYLAINDKCIVSINATLSTSLNKYIYIPHSFLTHFDSIIHSQCWGKILFKVMRYNIALLLKKIKIIIAFIFHAK